MSIHPERKLKKLLDLWPAHTVLPVAFLKNQGFSPSLIQRYVSSGWIAYFDRGTVVRPNDKIDWPGLLWGAQQVFNFHVGGKAALELQGKAHYIRFAETTVSLFSGQTVKLPHWLVKKTLVPQFVHIKTNLLPNDLGVEEHDFGAFRLKISNPARAFVEHMFTLKKKDAYDEVYYLMENLSFVSPALFQEILEACQSIRVKRLVLCLAKKVGANWLDELNMSKIDLGTGPREGVSEGKYDSVYKITYPREWDKNEDEVIF